MAFVNVNADASANIEHGLTDQESDIIHVQLLKKYRVTFYDNYDEMYATEMRKYVIPPAFNDFTDGLMDETHISREKLLTAIGDYNKTHPVHPLASNFEDSAFNYRPYQPCVIC
jgi:hypothetical protein